MGAQINTVGSPGKRVMKFGASIAMIWLLGVTSVAGQDQDTTVYTHGNGVTTPSVVKTNYVTYTPQAMRAGIQGSNTVEAIVLPDGTVGDVKLIRSLDSKYGLDQAAIDAAKKWLFKPGTKDGKAVAVRVTIKFAFTLNQKKSKVARLLHNMKISN